MDEEWRSSFVASWAERRRGLAGGRRAGRRGAKHEGGGLTAAARIHREESSSHGSTSASSPLRRSLLLSSRLVAPLNRHVRNAGVQPWPPPCSELGHNRRRTNQHAHTPQLDQARPWPPPRTELDPECPSTPRRALLAAESHGSGRRPAVFRSGRRCHLYSCPSPTGAKVIRATGRDGTTGQEAEHEG